MYSMKTQETRVKKNKNSSCEKASETDELLASDQK